MSRERLSLSGRVQCHTQSYRKRGAAQRTSHTNTSARHAMVATARDTAIMTVAAQCLRPAIALQAAP
eukprot:2657078-Prymnesium_polylepis.1